MRDERGESEAKNTLSEERHREPPILRRAATVRRAEALFRTMSTDFLLREQFVSDPAQIVSEYLYGVSLSPQKASVANQLLYAVMSNLGLLGWLRQYAITNHGNPPARDKIIHDFGRAVVENEGSHVVFALIRSSTEQEGVFGFDDTFFQIVFNSQIFTDDPGTGGAEGSGPGTNTTNPDPTTEMSTGVSTEQSTGTSSEKSKSFFGVDYVLTLEALMQYSIHLRDIGALEDTGVTVP